MIKYIYSCSKLLLSYQYLKLQITKLLEIFKEKPYKIHVIVDDYVC